MTIENKDQWKFRRRIVFGSTVATMFLITYIVVMGLTGEVAKTAINSGFLFMGGVVLTYLGGCATEDYIKNKGKK